MVSISGKFKLVRNENFLEYLQAYGVPDAQAEAVNSLRPTLEVQVDGKKISLLSDSGVDNASSTFILGEEVDEPLPIKLTLKSFATLEGNTLTIQSKSDAGQVGTRIYTFFDTELILIMTGNNDQIPEARRIYQRM